MQLHMQEIIISCLWGLTVVKPDQDPVAQHDRSASRQDLLHTFCKPLINKLSSIFIIPYYFIRRPFNLASYVSKKQSRSEIIFCIFEVNILSLYMIDLMSPGFVEY